MYRQEISNCPNKHDYGFSGGNLDWRNHKIPGTNLTVTMSMGSSNSGRYPKIHMIHVNVDVSSRTLFQIEVFDQIVDDKNYYKEFVQLNKEYVQAMPRATADVELDLIAKQILDYTLEFVVTYGRDRLATILSQTFQMSYDRGVRDGRETLQGALKELLNINEC